MQDSPIFSPIPDSVTSVTSSDTYYTAQEEVEVEEEILEVPLKPKLIERPKVVPLEEEKRPDTPEREIVRQAAPEEAMEVETEDEREEVRVGKKTMISNEFGFRNTPSSTSIISK